MEAEKTIAEITVLGLKIETITTILAILVILLIAMMIFTIHKMNIITRKYKTLMSGKKGADLEKVIRYRFKEMDKVKANAKRVTREHKEIKAHLSSCISKTALACAIINTICRCGRNLLLSGQRNCIWIVRLWIWMNCPDC